MKEGFFEMLAAGAAEAAGMVLSSAGPFIILLSILIFIHELGHFLAARWCGVQVETFSIGFGPKILKYKRGATVYCLSALPFGGYVKMFGDNPLKPPPEAERHKGFLYKKPWQKLSIAIAGPFMNLLFAFLAFMILAKGLPAYMPAIGHVKPGSKAFQKGLRPGDTILSIDSQKIQYLEEAMAKIQNSGGKGLTLRLRSSQGKIKTIAITVEEGKSQHLLNRGKTIGQIPGLDFFSQGTRIAAPPPGSAAARAGLEAFDEIVQINGQKTRYWRDLAPLLAAAAISGMAGGKVAGAVSDKALNKASSDDGSAADKDSPVGKDSPVAVSGSGLSAVLTVKRAAAEGNRRKGSEERRLSLSIGPGFSGNLKALGLERSHLSIFKVGKNTPAEQSGLLKGDKIIALGGAPVESWKSFSKAIQNYKGPDPMRITVLRNGAEEKISLRPKRMFHQSSGEEKIMAGVVAGMLLAPPPETKRALSLGQSLVYAAGEIGQWFKNTTVFLARMATGQLSSRNMAGPVGIGRLAHSSFQEGFFSFLLLMALLSFSLCYLNLLPVPMLDGGHIMFFSIEGIMGRPLDVKKLVAAQQIGAAAVASFFVFVLFNDIRNWIGDW